MAESHDAVCHRIVRPYGVPYSYNRTALALLELFEIRAGALLVPAGLGFVAVLRESRVRPVRAMLMAVLTVLLLAVMFQVTAVLAS